MILNTDSCKISDIADRRVEMAAYFARYRRLTTQPRLFPPPSLYLVGSPLVRTSPVSKVVIGLGQSFRFPVVSPGSLFLKLLIAGTRGTIHNSCVLSGPDVGCSIWDVFGVGYAVFWFMHGNADERELAVHVLLRRVWLLQPFERQIGCGWEPPVARYGGVVDGSCDEVCHAGQSKRVRWPVRWHFIELPHLLSPNCRSPTPRPAPPAGSGWQSWMVQSHVLHPFLAPWERIPEHEDP